MPEREYIRVSPEEWEEFKNIAHDQEIEFEYEEHKEGIDGYGNPHHDYHVFNHQDKALEIIKEVVVNRKLKGLTERVEALEGQMEDLRESVNNLVAHIKRQV